MNSQLMNQAQHSVAAHGQWTLAAGQALSLPVGPGARDLQVTEGRLWLTRVGTEAQPAEDIWLEAGDELLLDSGSAWVIEGWSNARFQLLVPPCRAARRVSASSPAPSMLQRASAWLSPAHA